ncbi:MAG: hypothetical protein OEZ58_03155, partial [Gammaproteobacteria bacterium]|nr:hypothetical protein [Gammaproteobacteria bacterium]
MSRLFFCILFLLFISACANTPNKSKQNIILSDDGLSEISLQKNWRKQHNLNQVASIQAADMQRELYLIVISEQVDPSRGISLTDYSCLTVSNIANNLEQAAITDQHELIIDGQKAIQTEVRGIINNIG